MWNLALDFGKDAQTVLFSQFCGSLPVVDYVQQCGCMHYPFLTLVCVQ